MKYLITGSSGFWGINMIEYIINNDTNYDITCVYNSDRSNIETYNVRCIKCELENPIYIDKLLDSYDCIIHLASIIKHTLTNAEDNIKLNVDCAKNVINLCKKVNSRYDKNCRIIIASTMGTVACFKEQYKYADENTSYSKVSKNWPYYYSKMLIEDIVNKHTDLDIVVIRPPVILGPNDKKQRATKRIRKFLSSNLVLYTSGTIPFCDVRDLVRFTYEQIHNKNPKRYYNIDGANWSIFKFYSTLETLTNSEKVKIYIPYTLGYLFIKTFEKCVKLPDVIELEMGHSYWNSDSLYTKNFEWTKPEITLYDTVNDIILNSNL